MTLQEFAVKCSMNACTVQAQRCVLAELADLAFLANKVMTSDEHECVALISTAPLVSLWHTCVAHVIHAGIRSTHSPYAVSRRVLIFVLHHAQRGSR